MAYGMGARVELQKKPSFWVNFNFLFKSDIDSFEGTECDKIRERIKKFNPNMFCLNADIKMGISNRKKSKQFLGKLFKSTLNNRLHRNLACVIDKSSRGAKLKRAFEELP